MIILSESVFNNAVEHAMIFFGGATGLGIISHAVDTWPTQGMGPKGLWFLGMIKYITGHRSSGSVVLSNAQELKTGQFPAPREPPAK